MQSSYDLCCVPVLNWTKCWWSKRQQRNRKDDTSDNRWYMLKTQRDDLKPRTRWRNTQGELWVWILLDFQTRQDLFCTFGAHVQTCTGRLTESGRASISETEREKGERAWVLVILISRHPLLLLHPAVQRDVEQWLHSALGFQSRKKPQSASKLVLEDGGRRVRKYDRKREREDRWGGRGIWWGSTSAQGSMVLKNAWLQQHFRSKKVENVKKSQITNL